MNFWTFYGINNEAIDHESLAEARDGDVTKINQKEWNLMEDNWKHPSSELPA